MFVYYLSVVLQGDVDYDLYFLQLYILICNSWYCHIHCIRVEHCGEIDPYSPRPKSHLDLIKFYVSFVA